MADLNKLVDQLSDLTLLEAAELKTLLEEKWGVKAAAGGGMMMAMPSTATISSGPEPEAQSDFTVVITDVGPKKIQVIKAVRTLTDLGLKEAKDLVESASPTVLEGVSKDRANEAKAALEAEGAQVQVK